MNSLKQRKYIQVASGKKNKGWYNSKLNKWELVTNKHYKINKMKWINTHLQIIPLNIDGLNFPI